MLENLKHNIWVFFARRRVKNKIKKLKHDLNNLSHVNSKEIETKLFIQEIFLSGLVYV